MYKLNSIKTEEDFATTYELMKKEFNFNTSFEEFMEIYKRVFDKIDYYKDVANYEVSLKDRCKIGIFSNLAIFDKERLDKQVNLKNYDYVLLSFEYGLRKPESEFYKAVQSKLPFSREDILFIDGRSDNVDAALKAGWNAFQATGLELDRIKEKCEEFLNN